MHMCYGLHMRTSPMRHTLAVLRSTIGLGQKGMAELVDCSTRTIQAIELHSPDTPGLKLSERLAYEISVKTGVSLEWLMKDDVEAPILGRNGKPYTLEAYERTRAGEIGGDRNFPMAMIGIPTWLSQVCRASLEAHERGESELLYYRLAAATSPVMEQFDGHDDLLQKWNASIQKVLAPGGDLASKIKAIPALISEILTDYYGQLGEQMKARATAKSKARRNR